MLQIILLTILMHFCIKNIYKYLNCKNTKIYLYDKIIIVDAIGGSGKSTLGKYISNKYGHTYISLDELTYGKNWIRKTNFSEEFNRLIKESNGKYIIEGKFNDVKNKDRSRLLLDLMLQVDNVIWLKIPYLIVVWRKLFRSFKRYFRIEENNIEVETLKNIKTFIKSDYNNYTKQTELLENIFYECWSDSNIETLMYCIEYPNYLIVL